MQALQGKVVVISGGTSGIGAAIAELFVSEGAKIAIGGRRKEQGEKLAHSLGKAAIFVRADVAVEADVKVLLETAVQTFGRVDCLVNNVGIPTPRLGMAFEDHSVEDFERLSSVNFRGVFLGCKHAVTRYKQQGNGGVILNTGSVAGLVGWGGTVYGATKGAVHQLTRAVAVEVAPFGIRVNAICPAAMPYTGFMAAGGLQLSGPELDAAAAHSGAMHPLGKPITAEDCAEAAVYLCSDAAANVTGVLLPVDGGYVAK